MRILLKLLVVLLCFFTLWGCKGKQEDESFVVATIDGKEVVLGDIDKALGVEIFEIKKRLYDIRERKLDEVIGTKLLEVDAKSKGITVKKLKEDILNKAPAIKDEDVNRFFEMAKKRNPGITKDDIKNYLAERQKVMEQRKYIETLRMKAKIETFITKLEPVMPRVDVSIDDDPMKGAKDAKVTIVEFTDFECPFCNRAHDIVERVLKEYEGKVRFVRRDFPLPFHKNAMLAHVAANCAIDQGKYWEYSAKIWKGGPKALLPKDLDKYAKELGLKMPDFNKCLKDKKYYDEVNKDKEDGSRYGVRGTPAFFINGKLISGARPFEDFKKIIDSELK